VQLLVGVEHLGMYIVQIGIEQNVIMVDFFSTTPENVPIAHRNVTFYAEFGALFVDCNSDIDVQSFGIVSFFSSEEYHS